MASAQTATLTRRISPRRIVGVVVLVAMIVAMVLSTKFLTPTELAAIAPKAFDPAATAQDLYTKAQADLPGQAADLGKVVPAIQSDPKSAADTYKAVSPNENAYVFTVKATGTVVEATDASLRIKVDGVPDQTVVLVPLTTAVNGSVLRDALGFKFADAPGQTQYQYVADELKKLMLADLQSVGARPEVAAGQAGRRRGRAQRHHHRRSPRPAGQADQRAAAQREGRLMSTATVDAAATPAPVPGNGEVVLRAIDISKTYGVTRALKGVNFEVRRGRVTVLFGENGAGKSTLMKILSGVEKPTGGQLELDGEPVNLASTTDAVNRGISIIHQELNLCANLSVRDNIFIGRELRSRTGGIDFAREGHITRELMERLEEPIRPTTLVQSLRVGQQQIVEIARGAADRHPDPDHGRADLRPERHRGRGALQGHPRADQPGRRHRLHLPTTWRRRSRSPTTPSCSATATWSRRRTPPTSTCRGSVRQMVGREADYDFRDAPRDYGDVALSVQNVTVAELDTGRVAVNDVSLDVRQGEIVCLYGLMGAGRTELMEAIAGRDPISGGRIMLGDTDLGTTTVKDRIALGLGLVPEDRQRDGLVQMMSVGANMSLASLLSTVKNAFIQRKAERSNITKEIADVRVKTAGPGALITSLSGGNQQKVVIGKMLLTDPEGAAARRAHPGIDVGAKGEIFSLLFREAQKGLAVLYVTSEVGEALTASHRLIVMSRGRFVREPRPAHLHPRRGDGRLGRARGGRARARRAPAHRTCHPRRRPCRPRRCQS